MNVDPHWMQAALWALYGLKLAWNLVVVYGMARRDEQDGPVALLPLELGFAALLVGVTLVAPAAAWVSPAYTAMFTILGVIAWYPVLHVGSMLGTRARERNG